MYFWKIKNLVSDIKSNKLIEKDRFKYGFVFIVFMTFLALMPGINYENTMEVTVYFLDLFVTILGTFFAYKLNGGANGNDFLGKYFAIGFVVSIRFLFLLCLPLLIIVITYLALSDLTTTALIEKLYFIASLVLDIALYWRICVHIKSTVVKSNPLKINQPQ